MSDLLPPHSGPAERSLAETVRIAFDLPVDAAKVWRPQQAPADFLPWLAWALSVDEWNASWIEPRKREAIAAAIEVHRRKGTLWSMKRALTLAGFPTARIIEDYSADLHDGAFAHDGTKTHDPSDHWADYRVVMTQPITIRQAGQVRGILNETAPARCRLVAMDFTEALNLHDGTTLHDGAFTHGVA